MQINENDWYVVRLGVVGLRAVHGDDSLKLLMCSLFKDPVSIRLYPARIFLGMGGDVNRGGPETAPV